MISYFSSEYDFNNYVMFIEAVRVIIKALTCLLLVLMTTMLTMYVISRQLTRNMVRCQGISQHREN